MRRTTRPRLPPHGLDHPGRGRHAGHRHVTEPADGPQPPSQAQGSVSDVRPRGWAPLPGRAGLQTATASSTGARTLQHLARAHPADSEVAPRTWRLPPRGLDAARPAQPRSRPYCYSRPAGRRPKSPSQAPGADGLQEPRVPVPRRQAHRDVQQGQLGLRQDHQLEVRNSQGHQGVGAQRRSDQPGRLTPRSATVHQPCCSGPAGTGPPGAVGSPAQPQASPDGPPRPVAASRGGRRRPPRPPAWKRH